MAGRGGNYNNDEGMTTRMLSTVSSSAAETEGYRPTQRMDQDRQFLRMSGDIAYRSKAKRIGQDRRDAVFYYTITHMLLAVILFFFALSNTAVAKPIVFDVGMLLYPVILISGIIGLRSTRLNDPIDKRVRRIKVHTYINGLIHVAIVAYNLSYALVSNKQGDTARSLVYTCLSCLWLLSIIITQKHAQKYWATFTEDKYTSLLSSTDR